MNLYILMPFLYFPEDKTEYIPTVISLIIFMTLACVAMYIFYKKSKKDEKEFNKKYSEQLQQVAKNNNEK